MENIVGTLSAITITISTISSFLSPIPAPQTPVVKEVKKDPLVAYVVKPGDSLQSIAQDHFGRSDYWTTIWNENSEIKNPDLIEKGDMLKIPRETPENPEELKEELVKKKTIRPVLGSKPIPSASPSVSDKSTPSASPIPETKTVAFNSPSSLNEAQLTFLGNCESGMTPTRNSGNGYYGAFQFSIGTWNSMGTGYDRADLAPLDVQKDAVQRLLARSSIFTQFPGCAAQMRAKGLL